MSQHQVNTCVFHGYLPPIPREACHPNRGKAATCSTGCLPPGGAQRRVVSVNYFWPKVLIVADQEVSICEVLHDDVIERRLVFLLARPIRPWILNEIACGGERSWSHTVFRAEDQVLQKALKKQFSFSVRSHLVNMAR